MSLLLLFTGSVAGPVTGNLAATEANDTPSVLAAVGIAASLAETEANDVASATGAVAVAGAAAIAEADDTLGATSALPIAGIVASIEGDDVPSTSGALDIVGSLAAVEQDDILVLSGAVGIVASLAITEEDDTFSASALVPILYPRRGGNDEWAKNEQRQRKWDEQLRRIIDRSWRIANGEIDPITFEPIPPPDYSAVIGELINQALSLDQARAEAFMAEQERMQEEEAIAVLLLAA